MIHNNQTQIPAARAVPAGPGHPGFIQDKGRNMDRLKDRLLNVEQVRIILNCSRRHVYNLIEDGDLPGFKIGGRGGIRVRASKLDAFLEKREREDALL